MSFHLRAARLDDRSTLEALIARSARTLSATDYTPAQIDGALRGAFGVDTQLIRDGTYFVIESEGRVVACGGWSHRRTLFGSDQRSDREAIELDPRVDAAKIRAFFVDPDHARHGLGTMILRHSESAAIAAGFMRLELMATLPGKRLYERHGYVAGEPVFYPVGPDVTIEFVPMSKLVANAANDARYDP